MKKLRILPGAAGIIALTATIGFVDGQRDAESEYLRKDQVTQISVLAPNVADMDSGDTLDPQSAYLVKIKRGDLAQEVLVDAATGNIVKS